MYGPCKLQHWRVSLHSLPQYSLDPRDDFMAGGVGGFVEVYDTRADVRFDVALKGCAADGDGREVTGADQD